MNCYIVSYPRSGNHWMRFIVEFLTGRPTLGCKSSEYYDIPIYKTEFKNGMCPIKIIDEGNPIARKIHGVNGINDDNMIVVVVRDYKECITRHNGFVSENYINEYYNIIDFYDKHKGNKLLVKYEDLINNNTKVADDVYKFFDCEDRNRLNDFKENLDKYRHMNKNVNGRRWLGSISGDDLDFHKNSFKSNFSEFDRYIDENYLELKNKYDIK